ncbi:MAG: hypothetical protein EOO75_00770 [Myxococcales bacterium]|nr:MAG: hypothetical protein EOO75_00770 [Myxococcales bacterium]
MMTYLARRVAVWRGVVFGEAFVREVVRDALAREERAVVVLFAAPLPPALVEVLVRRVPVAVLLPEVLAAAPLPEVLAAAPLPEVFLRQLPFEYGVFPGTGS